MPSQFFGLEISYSGLTAYQAALNTTGNNIANVETKGYSRQEIKQQAAQALRTYTSYGMAGAGTTVTSIDQIRNEYYDIKFHKASASQGEYAIKSEFLAQIENYFEDDGETILGFNSQYDSFFKALEDVENNPSDTATRIAFIGRAKSLGEYFNSMYEQLESLQTDANDQVKNMVDQINSIAEQIATLNKQINVIEMKGVRANELRDQRNLLVDELSKYVDVEVSESPIYSDKDNTVESGAYRYTVTISDTQTLVDEYKYRKLEVQARDVGNKVNQSDSEGLYDIFWEDTGLKYYPVGNNYSGQLNGLLQVRDGNNNEGFKGTILDVTPAASSASGKAEVTIETTAEYLNSINKLALNESGTIVLNNTEYAYESFECTMNDDGTSTFTFVLKSDDYQQHKTENINPAKVTGRAASIGASVDYQGIPYFMRQMNEWVRNFAKTFNDIEESGEDLYGNKLGDTDTAFFVAKDLTGNNGGDYNFVEGKSNTITSKSDSYYQLTAFSFKVSDVMTNDAGRMSTTATQGDINLEATDIVQQLEAIKKQKNFFRGCTSEEFLSCILGDVALNANSANNFEKNFANIQDAITNQRLSVSGVDNDEEALNLVKYQNAYNLSAKMIQVMTEIYDKLIQQTGV